MAVYEVLAVENPTKKEAEDGAQERIVFGPKVIVAKSEQAAAITAVIGEKLEGVDQTRLQVNVRPF